MKLFKYPLIFLILAQNESIIADPIGDAINNAIISFLKQSGLAKADNKKTQGSSNKDSKKAVAETAFESIKSLGEELKTNADTETKKIIDNIIKGLIEATDPGKGTGKLIEDMKEKRDQLKKTIDAVLDEFNKTDDYAYKTLLIQSLDNLNTGYAQYDTYYERNK
ncbi:MAG: hypothetical protein UR26_C0001G0231 [candidate division TM6 bacterium GW2011_GWF2_32_72]|nr:MAG: hypothetical protein UR26_C0001G0231 [candidate division TM6 bacterium GW2011_GWF2_32_72]